MGGSRHQPLDPLKQDIPSLQQKYLAAFAKAEIGQ